MHLRLLLAGLLVLGLAVGATFWMAKQPRRPLEGCRGGSTETLGLAPPAEVGFPAQQLKDEGNGGVLVLQLPAAYVAAYDSVRARVAGYPNYAFSSLHHLPADKASCTCEEEDPYSYSGSKADRLQLVLEFYNRAADVWECVDLAGSTYGPIRLIACTPVVPVAREVRLSMYTPEDEWLSDEDLAY